MSDEVRKKAGDKIILQGQGLLPEPNPDNLRGPVTAILDLKEKTVCCANQYPAIYGDADNIWHVFSYLVPSYDLSPQNEMVISFPADDSIRVYNFQTRQTRSYFAGYSIPYENPPGAFQINGKCYKKCIRPSAILLHLLRPLE